MPFFRKNEKTALALYSSIGVLGVLSVRASTMSWTPHREQHRMIALGACKTIVKSCMLSVVQCNDARLKGFRTNKVQQEPFLQLHGFE